MIISPFAFYFVIFCGVFVGFVFGFLVSEKTRQS